MHILFLSHYFPPEVNAPATRTFEHCRRWVASGHRVTVVTCAPNCPSGVVFDGYRNAWRSTEEMHGITVVRVWTFLAPNAGFCRRIVNYVSYMLRTVLYAATLADVDVVVATSPQFFCGWAGVICKWLRHWPFVLEIRDIWPASILAVGAMKRTRIVRVLEWLEQRMYAAADHIVTVGDGYKRELLRRHVPEGKISVVPNGAAMLPSTALRDPYEIRRQFDAVGRFVCTYVGTIGMAHGLSVVLDAAEKLKTAGQHHFQFWIVGDGAERCRLEHQARERCLDNVRFTGLVGKECVAAIMACADACLVHLRGAELFQTVIPSKIFEAMEANVPIIAGLQGDSRDLVIRAEAGVAMTPEDAQSLVQCLQHVMDNPGKYRGGRDFVARFYNRDELARRMLTVVLGEAGVPDTIPYEPVPEPLDVPARRAA